MAKRRNRRATARLKIRKAAKQPTKKAAKKKSKPKAPTRDERQAKRSARSKKAALTQKINRAKASVIKQTLPDLVKGKFLIVAPEAERRAVSFLSQSDTFALLPTEGQLFASKDEAQGAIDGILLLADDAALIRSATIEKATDHLETAYAFSGSRGADGKLIEYSLHVSVANKGTGIPFKVAKAEVQQRLTENLKATSAASLKAIAEAELFKETWA